MVEVRAAGVIKLRQYLVCIVTEIDVLLFYWEMRTGEGDTSWLCMTMALLLGM